MIETCMIYYLENAKKKERASQFMERIGVDAFKKTVLKSCSNENR